MLGAFAPVEPMDACLLAEIDEQEVDDSAIARLGAGAAIILLSSLLFLAFAGFLVSRLITRPLDELRKKVDEVTKGNFDVRLDESDLFEIRRLTDSLNRILASMKLAVLRVKLKKEEFQVKGVKRAEPKEGKKKK